MERQEQKIKHDGFSTWSLGRQHFEFTTPTSLKKSAERLQPLKGVTWLTQRRVKCNLIPVEEEQIVKFNFSRDANFGNEFSVSGYLQQVEETKTAVLGYGRLSPYFYLMLLLDVILGIVDIMVLYFFIVVDRAPGDAGFYLFLFAPWLLLLLADIVIKIDSALSRKKLIDLLITTLQGSKPRYFQTGDVSESKNVFSRIASFYTGPSFEFVSPLHIETCKERLKELGYEVDHLRSPENTWEFFFLFGARGEHRGEIIGKLQQTDNAQILVSGHGKSELRTTTVIGFLAQLTVFAVLFVFLCTRAPDLWICFPWFMLLIVAFGAFVFTVTKWGEHRLARLVYNALSSEVSTGDIPTRASKFKR